MYSLVSWNPELRTKFYLPYDPYYVGEDKQRREASDAAVSHLRKLGVIFYRDDSHGLGIILRPTIPNVPDYIEDGKKFDCPDPLQSFQFQCEVTVPAMEVTEWPSPEDRTLLPKHEARFKRFGDHKKWYRFNTEVLLRQVSEGMVSKFGI